MSHSLVLCSLEINHLRGRPQGHRRTNMPIRTGSFRALNHHGYHGKEDIVSHGFLGMN